MRNHIGPASSPFFLNPYLFDNLKNTANVLDFLYLKFMDDYWAPSHIPDLHRTVVYPTLTPEVAHTVNEFALTSPDSPLIPEIKDPVSTKITPVVALSTIAGLITKFAKGFFPLIPPFLYELINSKEKILQNINVEITATSKKKIYEIGFGKFVGEGVSIAFEVVAGKPIKLMHDEEAARYPVNFINPIFPSTSLFKRILNPLPPYTQATIWKRQEPHTECLIIVEDPGNDLLKDAQITHYIPLSENEGFSIIHRDPTIIKNPFGHDYSEYDFVEPGEGSEYVKFRSISVKLTEPMAFDETKRTEIFSLPFDDDPKKANDYYLEITQHQ